MVPVIFAPVAELRRTDIRLRRQSQLPDLHFELRGQSRAMGHGSAPVRVAAFSDYGWMRRAPLHRPKSYSDGREFAVEALQMGIGGSEFGLDLVLGGIQMRL